MKLHKDSHLDHGLTARQLAFVLARFESRDAFFIESVTLPEDLGMVPCGLYGPIMGDNAIPDSSVHMEKRGERVHTSRVLNVKPLAPGRTTNTITVIAGPHDGSSCVLYTVFGGPSTPKEPNDPTLADDKRAESVEFWSTHALAY